MEGKTVAISGYGNVAWGVAKKLYQLGVKVVTLSGPEGYVYDKDGVSTQEKIDYMLELRANDNLTLADYAEKFGAEFHPSEKPWNVKADIIMPCATQNEVALKEAEWIVNNGVKYYIEVSNMPTTNDALDYLMKNSVVVAPSKAVNAGGVAVSALEMSQNAMRYNWTAEEVDEKLQGIMKNIHDFSYAAAEEYGLGYDLVAGANICSFKKVAEAMLAEGVF